MARVMTRAEWDKYTRDWPYPKSQMDDLYSQYVKRNTQQNATDQTGGNGGVPKKDGWDKTGAVTGGLGTAATLGMLGMNAGLFGKGKKAAEAAKAAAETPGLSTFERNEINNAIDKSLNASGYGNLSSAQKDFAWAATHPDPLPAGRDPFDMSTPFEGSPKDSAKNVSSGIKGWWNALPHGVQVAGLSAGAVLSGYGLYESAQYMFHGGFKERALGWLGAATSGTSFYSSLHSLFTTVGFSGPHAIIMAAAALAIVLTVSAILNHLSRVRKASHDEVALDKMPTQVFAGAPVVLLMSGLALTGMGININPSAPMAQILPVDAKAVEAFAATQQAQTIDGKTVQATGLGSLYVLPGNGMDLDRVVYFVEENGKYTAHVTSVAKGMTFGNDPSKGGYLPFFTSGRELNAQAVNSVKDANALNRAAQTFSGTSAAYSATQAGMQNKDVAR